MLPQEQFQRHVLEKLDRLEAKLNEVAVDLARNYVTKEELASARRFTITTTITATGVVIAVLRFAFGA